MRTRTPNFTYLHDPNAANATEFEDYVASNRKRAASAYLLETLKAGQRTAKMLVVGDSLGYDTCPPGGSAIFDPAHSWPRLMAQAIGAMFPEYTVTQRNIDVDATLTWLPPVTLQVGTGAYTLELWDASVPGSAETWSYGARWAQVVTANDYDLIIQNYGHNYPNNLDFRDRFVTFLSALKVAQPNAGIIATLQNWGTNSPGQKKASRVLLQQEAAQLSIDTYDAGLQIELNGGNNSIQLVGDGTHLTILGQQIWAQGLIDQKFTGPLLTTVSSPSTLFESRINYLPDPFFQRTLGVAAANAWAGNTGDVVKTLVTTNNESTKPWGNKCAEVVSNGNIERYIGMTFTPLPAELLGRKVCLLVRMYRPSANAVENRNYLEVYDQNGRLGYSDNQIPTGDGVDGWMWRMLTITVNTNSSYLIVRINVAATGSALTGKVRLGCGGLFLGDLPADPVNSPDKFATPESLVISGVTGSMTVDLTGYATTNNPLLIVFRDLTGNVSVTNFLNAPSNSLIYVDNIDTTRTVTITQDNAVLPGGVAAVLGRNHVLGLVRGPVYWQGTGPIATNA